MDPRGRVAPTNQILEAADTEMIGGFILKKLSVAVTPYFVLGFLIFLYYEFLSSSEISTAPLINQAPASFKLFEHIVVPAAGLALFSVFLLTIWLIYAAIAFPNSTFQAVERNIINRLRKTMAEAGLIALIFLFAFMTRYFIVSGKITDASSTTLGSSSGKKTSSSGQSVDMKLVVGLFVSFAAVLLTNLKWWPVVGLPALEPEPAGVPAPPRGINCVLQKLTKSMLSVMIIGASTMLPAIFGDHVHGVFSPSYLFSGFALFILAAGVLVLSVVLRAKEPATPVAVLRKVIWVAVLVSGMSVLVVVWNTVSELADA